MAQGRQYLFVAIDRTSQFAYGQIHLLQSKAVAADFFTSSHRGSALQNPLSVDGQWEPVHQPCAPFTRLNIFLTVFAGRTAMNRSLKEATVKTFTYATTQQLKRQLHDFLMAYNFAKRLKAFRGKPPW